MIVDVEIWYWTPSGMTQRPTVRGDRYITVRDSERLLEEADLRRLNQERARFDEEFERRRDTGEP